MHDGISNLFSTYYSQELGKKGGRRENESGPKEIPPVSFFHAAVFCSYEYSIRLEEMLLYK